ncbi:primosomal protein N' [Marisediminicola sp. LYQ134]|uniref:primosomal protein N' family DNA-binding protein n=1 Tax=Marisediminicola sp. LYQ134 TaxID=3391061 RepID=UPI0039835502
MIDSTVPQLDRLFDYAIPESLTADVAVGVRVRVPVRSAGRIADGFVVEIGPPGDYAGTLSELDAVVSSVPVLTPDVWALARAVADRAAGTASDVVRLAVPKRQVRVEKAWLARADDTDDGEVSTDATGEVSTDEAAPGGAAPGVRERAPGKESRPGLESYAPADRETALARGARYAVDAVPRPERLRGGVWVGAWARTAAAAAAETLARGESAIVCVPDYRDQEQLEAALADEVAAHRVVRIDARQSNPHRYRAHLAGLDDEAIVVVGNRSAVYAAAPRLGLMIVVDDGDPLHSEPLSPYVHSRDAALVRSEQAGCGLWFLSHSRTTEVQRLVELGFLSVLSAARTYSPRVVPTAQQSSTDRFAAMARIPSTAWREARAALEHGPVLVQVARPGYSPRTACATCSAAARCTRCDGALSRSRSGAVPACSLCGKLAADWVCPVCEGTTMTDVGQGSVRTADELGRAFPGVRVIVADGTHPVLRVDDGPALVVATRGAEPLADGGYRAVLLLDGERMLARESLRVGEDCLRWWTNAAALAAPGSPVVLVGVGGPLASTMATWRPAAYASTELADRRRLRFPPAVRVATVTGATAAVEKAVATVAGIEGLDVLGPVETSEGVVRAIIRFEFRSGREVATALRAAVITAATSRRKPVPRGPRPVTLPTLKVRLDDIEPFAE